MDKILALDILTRIPSANTGRKSMAIMVSERHPYPKNTIIAGVYTDAEEKKAGAAVGNTGSEVTNEEYRKAGLYVTEGWGIYFEILKDLLDISEKKLPQGPFGKRWMYVVRKGANKKIITWDENKTYHPGYRIAILDEIAHTKRNMSPVPDGAIPLGNGAYLLPEKGVIIDERGKELKEETRKYRELMEREGYWESDYEIHPLQMDEIFEKVWRRTKW